MPNALVVPRHSLNLSEYADENRSIDSICCIIETADDFNCVAKKGEKP